MSKVYLSTILFSLCIFIFSGCTLNRNTLNDNADTSLSTPIATHQEVVTTPNPTPLKYTARFEIFTNGTKRIFTDAKYHRQSPDVYIENPDPHLIHVQKPGLTWNDFFTTLPFSLKKDCLVTGTKQTFCNTETKKLYFAINGQEVPDALERSYYTK